MKRMPWIHAVIALAGVAAAAPATPLNATNPPGGGPAPVGAPVITVRRDQVAAFAPNGTRSVGEYPTNADEFLNLTGGTLLAKVYLKRYRDPVTQAEELRIYFAINDTDLNALDRIDFYFDRLHDHGGMGNLNDDVLLRIPRVACASPCTAQRASRGGGDLFVLPGTSVNLTNAVVLTSHDPGEGFPGVGNRWTGEFVLRPQDLGWDYFPASVGMMVVARSADVGTPRGWFPAASNGDELLPAGWSDVRLRYPIDFALSLDYSGSMTAMDGLTQNRWVRAKRAADLFAAALGLFHDANFPDDRIALSQYSWSCSNDTNAGNTTGQVPGVMGFLTPAGIPTPPTGTTSLTSANNSMPPGNNCTPIRQGLEFALNTQLSFSDAALQDRKDRVVVLLSDGFHNTPNAHVPFDPGAVFTANQKAFANVGTVALGPDASAGTLLLSQIATAFNGSGAGVGTYNQTTHFEELMESYLEVLQEPFAINAVPVVAGSFTPGAVDKMVLIGVWNDPTQATNLRVQHGADPAIDGTISNTRIGYAALTVTDPAPSGSWTFLTPLGTTTPDHYYVLVDLRTLARFPVEQRDYVTGEPILLRVVLTEAGQPVLGADARVEIARPGEGLGNVLSTLRPSCDIGIPHIPQIGRRGDPAVGTVSHLPTMGGTPAGAAAGDPPPLRYALAASLFEKCGKEELDRDTLAGEKMYDDGTHGDATPGDGVYTLSFDDTRLEGSYNFRFNVRGTESDGTQFARTRRFSQFVQVKPTPAATQHVVQAGGVIGGMQTAVYWFLPRDAFENYQGPGFADVIRVSVPFGSLGGPLFDAGNGWYGQEVRWPERTPPPPVRVEMPMNGFVTTLGPVGTGGDFGGVGGTGRGRSEWEIFGSWTMLDDALNVDDALGLGIRFGAPLAGALRFELEGATTFPELGDDSVRVSQLFAGLRLEAPLMPALLASGSAGGGVMHFSGGGAGETAGAGHASGALTLLLSPHFGIRGTGRVLYVSDVLGAGGSTTGTQATVGLVFRP
jgi:hypothetical protein